MDCDMSLLGMESSVCNLGFKDLELNHPGMRLPHTREHRRSTLKSSQAWIANCSYNIPKDVSSNVLMESAIPIPSEVKERESPDIYHSQSSEYDVLMAHYIPVYVMLPLDMVSNNNKLMNEGLLHANLCALKNAHVDGLMIDVWWGIVEQEGPKQYNWSAYRSLFEIIQSYGFKLQPIMSFHQCGGNVSDSCFIPLPNWILKEGESNPDIFFTNRGLIRNRECLSFGIDDKPVLNGRTAVQVYTDFMKSFKDNMQDFLESGMITELEVGLGPAGELRYPSFSSTLGWHFPGIGEFQCYDKYLLSDLKEAAIRIDCNEWGHPPEDSGNCNDWPDATGFFRNEGTYTTDYGKFFLKWYSDALLAHGDKILGAASHIFAGYKLKLAAKIAGIHWWYNSRNHAAELAAGYYNLRDKDGYEPIAKMLSSHKAVLNFTCIEMRDEEHPWEIKSGPENLVRQVLNAGWKEGIEVSCENALPRYDRVAYDQILYNARPDGVSKDSVPKKRIYSFTYLRLGGELMQENNWREFNMFVRKMHAGLDYHPEPDKYYHPRVLLEPSRPLVAVDEEDVAPKAAAQAKAHTPPFPFNLIQWLWPKNWFRNKSAQQNNAHPNEPSENDDFPGFSL